MLASVTVPPAREKAKPVTYPITSASFTRRLFSVRDFAAACTMAVTARIYWSGIDPLPVGTISRDTAASLSITKLCP